MTAPKAKEIDIGYPFRYFIPSTLFDVEVDEKELETRTALIETVFLTNYGGVTIDSWTAKHGSYKLIQSQEIIREKIAIALSYMTQQEFDDTFDILINDLNILNCGWWLQESYLYSWRDNAKIVLCHQQILKSTEWIYCKKQFQTALFWVHKEIATTQNWQQCEKIPINCQFNSCKPKRNQQNMSRILSEIVDTFGYKTDERIIEGNTNLNQYSNMDLISLNNIIVGLLILILMNMLYISYKFCRDNRKISKDSAVPFISNQDQILVCLQSNS